MPPDPGRPLGVLFLGMGVLALLVGAVAASGGALGVLAAGAVVVLALQCAVPRDVLVHGYLVAVVLSPVFPLGGGVVGVSAADVLGVGVLLRCSRTALLAVRPGGLGFLFYPVLAASLSLAPLALLAPDLFMSSSLRVVKILVPVIAGCYVAARRVDHPSAFQRLPVVLLACGTLGAVVAVVLFVSGAVPPWTHAEQYLFLTGEVRLRGQGLLGEATSLANLMLLLACIAVFAVEGRPVLRSVGVVAMGAAALTTASRSALIAAVVLVASALLVHRPRPAVLLATLTACAAPLTVGPIREGLLNRLVQSQSAGSVEELTSGRTREWLFLLRASFESPATAVLGHGYGSVRALGDDFFSDNQLISTLYVSGLLGVALLVAFALGLFRTSSAAPPRWRSALLVWLLVELVFATTADALTFSRTLAVWFALLGLVTSSRTAGQPPPGAAEAPGGRAVTRRPAPAA